MDLRLIQNRISERSNGKMKKTLMVGLGSLVLAALPTATSFAATSQQINATVTVGQSCELTRTSGEGTYSKTMNMNTYDANFGSSTLSVVCNNLSGFKVKGTFTDLVNGANNDIKITYTSAQGGVSGGSGTWTAVKGDSTSTTAIASGVDGNVMSSGVSTGTTPVTQQITYKVGTSASQAAGTYTGTATYELTSNSAI